MAYNGRNDNRRRRRRGGGGGDRSRRGGNDRKRERSIEELEREYVNRLRNDGKEKAVCPICDKPIIISNQAIRHRESGKPAHFDCVLRALRDVMKPAQGEKIAYLGGGSFGVIQERNNHGRTRFVIRESMQYEERKKRGHDKQDDASKNPPAEPVKTDTPPAGDVTT
ncbi:MAG: hypothetical protein HZC28_15500 [Spirochaetes bacterium]|nr:hypothetical protein [Spirochaetota bacterium]